MKRLPLRVELILASLHVVAFATFVRSAVLGYWATALAATALAIGAAAAFASRTWGVGLAAAAGIAFGAAAALGMGPGWFWLVATAGVLPYAATLRPMLRFDVGAAVLFGALAAGAGIACAVGWQVVSPLISAR